ncbi:MAG: GtrA family protein [Patescibacteria group bacterium]
MKRMLSHPFVRKHLSQGMKFIVAGGIGSLIDLLSLTLLVEYVSLDPRIAFVCSSILGASFVFIVNKFITFGNHERKFAHQIFKFTMVYGVAIALNAALSTALHAVGLHYFISKLLAIGVIAIWNYSLSHGFIFKKKEKIEPAVF